MRRIAKPEPPQDVYPDGQARASLQQAEEAYLADLSAAPNPGRFARVEYHALDKRKLRAVLYREQRSLCVFCERRVAEGYPSPRIDHWYPLHANHRLALHWENLYLSCSKLETCDSAKAGHAFRWDSGDMPWPIEFRYEDVVGFSSRGEIYVRSDVTLPDGIRQALQLAIDDRTDGDQVRRGIVKLNDPALVKARAAAVRGERRRMEQSLENGTTPDAEREARAAQLLDSRPLPEFVSIRVAWLRNTLGCGL